MILRTIIYVAICLFVFMVLCIYVNYILSEVEKFEDRTNHSSYNGKECNNDTK